MANFTLVDLLRYPPFEAALIVYNDAHGTSLNPRYVMLDGVPSGEGQDIVVGLKARTDLPNSEERRFTGAGSFTLRRLNLEDLFTEPFELSYPGEVVSFDVATAITKVTGIVFEERDFIREVITPENTRLKAAPTSLRWYGSIEIKHRGLKPDVPLSDILGPVVSLTPPDLRGQYSLDDLLPGVLTLTPPDVVRQYDLNDLLPPVVELDTQVGPMNIQLSDVLGPVIQLST